MFDCTLSHVQANSYVPHAIHVWQVIKLSTNKGLPDFNRMCDTQKELGFYKTLSHTNVVGYIYSHFDAEKFRLLIFLELVKEGGSQLSLPIYYDPSTHANLTPIQ